jgi:hypothetical protein
MHAILNHAHNSGAHRCMLHRLRPFIWGGVRTDVPDWTSFSFATRIGAVLTT